MEQCHYSHLQDFRKDNVTSKEHKSCPSNQDNEKAKSNVYGSVHGRDENSWPLMEMVENLKRASYSRCYLVVDL